MECIIDRYKGKYSLFDGYSYNECIYDNPSYSQICINNKLTNNIVFNTFVGILHLSSKKVYTTGKVGQIQKEFTPFIKNLPKILVKTKKINISEDICAIVQLDTFDKSSNILYCTVLEYLYDTNYKLLYALSTCHWNNSHKFNKEFITLKSIDLTNDRSNYTHLPIYSIDPHGCTDIDDALHCIKTDIGYEIGIHIADVSSYIEENSIFDIELSKRISSIYLHEQINMIPSELSINTISLKENQIKRAFSVILILNNEYDIIDVCYKKTLINVTKNMSYEECQQIIDNNANNNIINMYNIGLHLKNKLLHSFDPTEIYDTHQMVAVFMIYTNKLVAEKIASICPSHILLRSLPVNTHNNIICNNHLEKLHNIITKERAFYKMNIINSRHNGLNLDIYTHFTSPIRRYADILVHRQLWKVLNNIEIKPISTKTLFLINSYSKIYKQIERYYNLINIINSPSFIDINNIELDAYIIFINSNENDIKLYIEKMNIIYDYTLIHNKLKHLISTNIEENILTVTNINTKEEIILKLFDLIKIKISISRNNMNKLNIMILQPDIYNLCL